MHNKKIIMLLPIVVLSFLIGGCATKTISSAAPIYSVTPTASQQITPEPSTTTPTPNESTSTTPTAPGPTTNGDISQDDLNFLLKYQYDDIAAYNEIFTESTTSDLDDDGQEEHIALKAGGEQKSGDIEYYTSMKVQIGTEELTLKADDGWNFGNTDALISGTILDLDKDDGIKELLIETQNNYETEDVEPQQHSILITLDDLRPKVLTKLDFLPEATGTGYIADTEYSKQLAGDYAIAVQSFLHYIPRIGFRETSSDFTRAISYTSVPPEEGDGYPTDWEQLVAERPGGKPVKTIKEGTIIYFGPFYAKGWMELHDVQGTTLGWLDLNKVDVDEYIGYALQASCH